MADTVYYNAELLNTNDFSIDAVINDIRAQPIIQTAEEYDLSIIRWDLDTSNIPPCHINMSHPLVVGVYGAETEGVLSLSRGGDVFTLPVCLPIMYSNGNFYSFVELLRAMNDTLGVLFAMISTPSSSSQPYFSYSPITQLISLYYQETYNTGSPPIKIYANKILYRYILNLPANLTNIPDREYQLDTGNISAVSLPATGQRDGYPAVINSIVGNMLCLSQQFPAMNTWNASKTIYITTDSIPVVSEFLATTPASQSQNFGSSTSAIITDFTVSQLNPLDSSSRITYLPTAEYRTVSMRGLESIYRINLRLYWTDYSGNSYPITIPPNGYFSAKLVFIRKH